MEEVNALASKINEHLSWNQARITFLAQFILALLKGRSTNLYRVAEKFQGHALTESSYRRIKRFFARYEFSFQVLGQLILRWISTDKYILCMDRTNWKYGKEFSEHKRIAKAMKCKTYFAKPYHSWQRGQNENANGLLRQYFPKTMELIDISQRQVLEAVHKRNRRPRKCLGYKTPYEAFKKLTGTDVEKLMGYAFVTLIRPALVQ